MSSFGYNVLGFGANASGGGDPVDDNFNRVSFQSHFLLVTAQSQLTAVQLRAASARLPVRKVIGLITLMGRGIIYQRLAKAL